MYHSFLIHSFTGGHLGCFQHLTIVNNTAMNISVHRFFWTGVSEFFFYCCSVTFVSIMFPLLSSTLPTPTSHTEYYAPPIVFVHGSCIYVLLSGRSSHWCQWGVKVPCYDWMLLISLFISINICFMCSSAPIVGCLNVFKGYILLLDWSLYHYIMSSFVSYGLGFKVYFVWYSHTSVVVGFRTHPTLYSSHIDEK